MLRAALTAWAGLLACTGAAAQVVSVQVRATPAVVAEGSAGAFEFTLSAVSAAPTLAFYRISAQGSATAEDYSGALAESGAVVFPPNTRSVLVGYTALNDGVNDSGETLVVELLSAPGGAAPGAPGMAQAILNDHPRSLTLTGPERIAEGETASYAVGLSGWTAPAGGLQLEYRIVGAGSRPAEAEDWGAAPGGRLSIDAGAAAGEFSVMAALDDAVEGIERFAVEISGAVTAPPQMIATGQRFTTEIADAFELRLEGPPGPVAEGETARFAIRLAGGALQQRIFVYFRTTLAGAGEEDFERPPGTALGGAELVALPAGAREVLLDYRVLGDMQVEDAERFGVELLRIAAAPQLPGALRISAVRAAQALISANGGVLALLGGASPGSAAEESGARIVFAVQLRGEPVTGAISLHFRASGSAAAGSDYRFAEGGGVTFDRSAGSGTLALAAGARRGEIALQLLDDAEAEAGEFIAIELSGAEAALHDGMIGVETGQRRVEIFASDSIHASIRARSAEISEGGEAVFDVSLAGAAHSEALMLDYAVSGSALAGADYSAAPGTLQIAVGARSGVLRIASLDDAEAEPAETLVVTLRALRSGSAGALSVSNAPAEVTIAPSDQVWAFVRALTPERSEESPTPNDAQFQICLAGEPLAAGEMLTVVYRLSGSAVNFYDRGAMPFYDYTQDRSDVLVMGDSYHTQPFTELGCQGPLDQRIFDDSLNEGPETIVMTLTGILPAGTVARPHAFNSEAAQAVILASDPTRVGVVNCEAAGMALSCGSDVAPAPAPESGELVFGIAYSGGAPTAPVTLQYAIGGDVESGDYTDGNNGEVTFAADAPEAMRRIRIAIADDAAPERMETLTVTLTSASGGGGGGISIPAEGASASAGIASNDRILHAELQVLTEEVTEGFEHINLSREAQFRICLSGEALAEGSTARVHYQLSGSAGNSFDGGDFDYTQQRDHIVPGENPGEYIQTLSAIGCGPVLVHSIRDDGLNEGAETVVLALTRITGGNSGSALSYDPAPKQSTIAPTDVIQLGLQAPGAALAEGSDAIWIVELSGGLPTADVLLPWTLSGIEAGDVTGGLRGVRRISTAEAEAARRVDNPVPITLAIGIAADGLAEDAESVRLSLDQTAQSQPSSGGGVIEITGASAASAQIPANGGVRAVVSAASQPVPEGGVAVFSLRLFGEAHTANLLLDYALSGEASAGSDYSAPPELQQILPPGARTGEIRLAIADDAQTEGAERVILRLTRLVGVAADGPFAVDATPAAVTIAGSDGVSAWLQVLQGDVAEPGDHPPGGGVRSAAVFEFCLQGTAPAEPVTLLYSDAEGAAVLHFPGVSLRSAADYAVRGGTPGGIELAGLGCTPVTFDVLADDLNEPAEEMRLSIQSISGGGAGAVLSYSLDAAVATIRASDPVTISVRGPAQPVREGESAVFEFGLAGGISSADILIPISLGGVSAADLSSGVLSGSRSISPAQAAAARRLSNPEAISVRIEIADDALLESAETLILTLDTAPRGPSGGGGGGVQIAPGEGQARAVIAGSDGIRASLAASQQRVLEGGEALFVVSLAGEAHSEALFVDYRVGGSARLGVDHTGVASGALRIPAGANSGALRFAIANDEEAESGETILVTLAGLRGGGLDADLLAFSNLPASVEIAGNDGLFASVLLARSEVAESDETEGLYSSSAAFRICLEGEELSASVEVFYRLTGSARPFAPGISLDPTQPRPADSMLPFADYYLVSGGMRGSVVLHGLGCSGEIELGVYGDSLNEGAERIIMDLLSVSGGGISAPDFSMEGASVGIRASDPIRAALAAPEAAQREGGSAVFRLSLSGGVPTANVVIPYRIGGDIDSGDYTDSGGGRLAVTPAQAAAAAVNPLGIAIGIADDTVVEARETLLLSLGTPSSAGEVSVSPEQLEAVIADDDEASAVLGGGVGVPEGGGAADAFTLRLMDGDAPRSTAVPVRILYTLSGAAEAGADYTLEAGGGLSLTQAAPADGAPPLPAIFLDAGSSGGTLRIAPAADDINEPGESVVLTLGRVLDGSGADFARIRTGATATSSIADDDEIVLVLSGGGAVREGGVASFRVSLQGGVHSEDIVLPWTSGPTADTADDDAEPGDTAAISTSPLRIAQGSRSGEIRLRIVADGVMEPAESFALSLGSPSGGGGGALRTAGSPRTATIAASENTDRSVEITGPARTTEGAGAEYRVEISGDAPAENVLVRWSVSGSGATPAAAADFPGDALPVGGPLTFTPANYATPQTFSVVTQTDALLEGEERFAVTLSVSTSSADVTSGDGASLTTAIGDGNSAELRIARVDGDGFGEAGAVGAAARSAVFAASVHGAQLTAPAEVDFSVAGCGGGADCDFSPASPLRIAPVSSGVAMAQIVVSAADDALNEAPEIIRISMDGARSAGRLELGGTRSAEASLADDDAIRVAIANASSDSDPDTDGVQVNEGGRAVFRVTLAGAAAGSAAAVMVPYSIGGAVADSDYRDITASRSRSAASGGTLLIPAATASGLITLEVVWDVLAEGDEALRVTLGEAVATGPGGGAIARSDVVGEQSAAVVIPANQAALRSFSVVRDGAPPFAPLAEGGEARFRVTLSGVAPTSDASVGWNVLGVADSDWQSATLRTLRFTPQNWQTPQFIRIVIADDALNEGAETLRVVLSGAAGGGAGGLGIAEASAEVALSASDPLRYEISADQRLAEGGSGAAPAVFLVTLSGATGSAGGALRIPFQVVPASTAQEFADYTLSTAPLVFSGDSLAAEIRVFVLGDALFEPDETVILELGAAQSGPAAGVIAPGRIRATLTIANDDAAPSAGLTLAIARGDDDGFAEGGAAGAGTAVFRVTLSGGALRQPVSALFSVDGDIDAGDYEIVSPSGTGAGGGTLSIAPPESTAEIVLRARDDDLNEPAETLRVTLSDPVGGGGQLLLLGAATASAILAASDGAILRLARRGGNANLEEGEAAVFAVELNVASAGDVSVAWQAEVVAQTNTAPSGPRARNGATAPEFRAAAGGLRADGLGVGGVVQIPAGALHAEFHITPARDQREEDAETLRVTLGVVTVGPGGGAVAAGDALQVVVSENAAGEAELAEAQQQRRREQRITTALAALDRGATSLAHGAIRMRMERHRQPSHSMPPWLRIAGHPWRSAPREAARRPAGGAPLGLALYGAAGRSGVNFDEIDNMGNGRGQGGRGAGAGGARVPAPRAAPFAGLGAGIAGDANLGRRFSGPGRAGWLRGSRLELPRAGESAAAPRELRVWASGALAESRFDPGRAGGALAWKLSSAAAHIGVEAQGLGGALLAGAAVGASDGSLDFTDRAAGEAEADEMRGTAESFVLSLHPYFGWQFAPGFHAWFTLGGGFGELRILEQSGPAAAVRSARARSDSSLWTAAGGVSGKLRLRRLDLAVSLETSQTHSRLDAGLFSGGDRLPGVSASTNRISGEIELALNYAPRGISLRPFASLRTRRDAGDAAPGATHMVATDAGGGLALDWPALGLALDLRGRAQLAGRGAGRLDERSFTSAVSWDPGVRRRGLQLAIESGRNQRGLSGEVAYGLALRPVFAPAGLLLIPYSRVTFGAAERRWAAGLRLRGRPGGGESLRLGLEGGLLRRPGAPGAGELLLRAELRF